MKTSARPRGNERNHSAVTKRAVEMNLVGLLCLINLDVRPEEMLKTVPMRHFHVSDFLALIAPSSNLDKCIVVLNSDVLTCRAFLAPKVAVGIAQYAG